MSNGPQATMTTCRFAISSMLCLLAASVMAGPTTKPTTAPADPFTDEWGWVYDFTPGLVVGVTSKFHNEGGKLTGVVSMGPREPAKIEDGQIKGNEIKFKISFKNGDETITSVYTGTLKNDVIKGNIDLIMQDSHGKPYSAKMPWLAERAAVIKARAKSSNVR